MSNDPSDGVERSEAWRAAVLYGSILFITILAFSILGWPQFGQGGVVTP